LEAKKSGAFIDAKKNDSVFSSSKSVLFLGAFPHHGEEMENTERKRGKMPLLKDFGSDHRGTQQSGSCHFDSVASQQLCYPGWVRCESRGRISGFRVHFLVFGGTKEQ